MAEFKISRLRYNWRGPWATATTYNRDDIVSYGGSSWSCVRQHTSTTFDAAQSFLLNPGDTSPTPAWTRTSGGYGYYGLWTADTSYVEGSVVQSGGNLYTCINGHQSGTYFNSNLADWVIYAEGNNWRTDWSQNTRYRVGDVVKYNGITYRCILEHTSASTSTGITVGNNDTFNDSTGETWEIIVSNIEYRSDYATSTAYRLNDYVKYGGSILRCTADHSSSATPGVIDTTKFQIELQGFNFYPSWSASTYYSIGDLVKQGGYIYIANNYNYNSQPGQTASYSTGNINWTAVSKARNFAGNYVQATSYKSGDLVYRNGYLYVALQDVVADGSTLDYLDATNWEIVVPGQRFRGYWNTTDSYGFGDIVYYKGKTYLCITAHIQASSTYYPGYLTILQDGSTTFTPWDLLIDGDDEDGTELLGDIISYGFDNIINDSSQSAVRVPIGNEDTVLSVVNPISPTNTNLEYRVWGNIARVFHVRKNGIDDDDPNRGINYFKPYKTVRFAAEKADDNFNGFTTIKVAAGIYEEVLPIILPARVAIVGDELRSVTVKANDPIAALTSDAPKTIDFYNRLGSIMSDLILGNAITVTPGNTETQNTTYTATATETNIINTLISNAVQYINYAVNDIGTAPSLSGSNSQTSNAARLSARQNILANKEFLAAEGVAYTEFNYPTYDFDPDLCKRDTRKLLDAIAFDLLYPGNYKTVLAARYYANAVIGSSHEDMFYVRDATGIRNVTMQGLVGELLPQNQDEVYQRPDGGNYVSLDPGWGPADERTWINTRSCYVQNCTTFGFAATGQKIDGSLHNGGNKSIVSNDFTQIISDGIGCHVLNGGRAELVSVFTYYSHIGMFAEQGGIIRATNGNSSYGTFGAIADGIDPDETVRYGKVNTRSEQAQVASAFSGEVNDYILILEFANAGQEYTTATYNITSGSGTGASAVQDEVRDNAIFAVDVLDDGSGYVLEGRQAQTGNTTSITLATNETSSEAEIIGARIILTSGEGTGQYGYIYSYNDISKIALVYKESTNQPGWDHVIPGTLISSLLTTSTTYRIEPRVIFSHPGFTATEVTLDGVNSYTSAAYGETYETFSAVQASLPNLIATAASFNVVKSARTYTAVSLSSGGTEHAIGDEVTISGADIGGVASEHDITITVTGVASGGVITTFTYSGLASSGKFVIIPASGSLGKYSKDGATWSNFTLPTNTTWTSVAAGNTRFVAIASSTASAASSRDGITWTSRTMPSSRNWLSVVYGDGIFVAISDTADVGAYSTDGENWTSTTLPDFGDSSTNEWRDITYGHDKFVAVSSSNNAVAVGVWTGSTINWTAYNLEVQDSSLQDWISVAYGNGRFVAISQAGYVSYSFDGIEWTTSSYGMPPSDSTEMSWRQVRYGQGVFLAVCTTSSNSATTYCATSYDGINWDNQDLATSNLWKAVCFASPDISLGDSTVSNNTPMWVAVGANSTDKINTIKTGARALGRAIVETGGITSVRLWDPGSGYSTAPTVTFIDPGNITDAEVRIRTADGVLAQPVWSNRGTNYKTSTTDVAITGDGFADITPVGKFIVIDNLTVMPGPGAQFYIGGRTDFFTAVVVNLETIVTASGIRSKFQISPRLTLEDYILDDMEVLIRERYSQVRITGHDFLDVGTGNFVESNYPELYIDYNFSNEPQNEVGSINGGRVFYTSTDQDGNFRAGELFAVEQATGIVTISADFFDLSGLTEIALGGITVGGSGTVIREFSTDPTFAQNSNNIVPTQRAIRAYLQSRLNIGGEDLLTASFIAGAVRVGPNLINSTASLTINIPVLADFSGPTCHISGSIMAQSLFYKSFRDD